MEKSFGFQKKMADVPAVPRNPQTQKPENKVPQQKKEVKNVVEAPSREDWEGGASRSEEEASKLPPNQTTPQNINAKPQRIKGGLLTEADRLTDRQSVPPEDPLDALEREEKNSTDSAPA